LTGITCSKTPRWLNARAEDPDLWNDPQEAQKLMRERQHLEIRFPPSSGWSRPYPTIRRAHRNGRGGKRCGYRLRGRGGAQGLGPEIAKPGDRIAAVGRGRQQRHLPRSSFRRRRHREPGLGVDASAHVHPLGRKHGYKVELLETPRRRRGGHQVCDAEGQGPQRLWLAEDRKGVHRLVRISPYDSNARRHTSFEYLDLSGDRRFHRDRHQRERLPHRHLPGIRRRRPARQHDRFCRAHHPQSDRHRGAVPAGTLAAQEPRQGLGHAARPSLRAELEKARGRGQRGSRRPRPRSAGVTRSAPTFCSPISWSRTCAPARKHQPAGCARR
jgi:hypothetical protein